jgi:polyhydroxyalkanoate synthesis repressor PhaR
MEQCMILIKRYANRKMYNTTTRSYVTLDEIADLLQGGGEVSVIDHTTGEDITTSTLTQILAQQEKSINGSVPQDLLQRMVQLSGLTLNAMKESMQAFLDPIAYVAADIQRRLDILAASGKLSLLEREHWESLLLDPELSPSLVINEEKEPAATIEDLQKLIDQIDALEARLAELDTTQE